LRVESDLPPFQGNCFADRQEPDQQVVETRTMHKILKKHFRELQSKSAELK